jgi:hypothetical protein
MYPIQSNTKRGPIVVAAGDDLSGKEGYLVKLGNDGGTAKAYLPTAVTDEVLYVVGEGAAAGSNVTLIPLESGMQVRIVSNSTTFVPGDKVVGYASQKAGLATEYSGSGAAFIVGIAEEVGDTAGQYLLVRPVLSHLTV